MRAALMRTGSFSGSSPTVLDSPRCSLARRGSVPCFLTGEGTVSSPRKSLHFELIDRRECSGTSVRRAFSKSDFTLVDEFFSGDLKLNGIRARLPEEKDIENFPKIGISMDEKGRSCCRDGSEYRTKAYLAENSDRSKIGAYYREMLQLNPNDSLLLRNYGTYLHEVEKDTAAAAEYYGRAILNSPEDGELLCLYGNLVWESERDKSRATSYLDRAILASPNDCMVLGSYAHLMWEAEVDEEVDKMFGSIRTKLELIGRNPDSVFIMKQICTKTKGLPFQFNGFSQENPPNHLLLPISGGVMDNTPIKKRVAIELKS